MQKLPFDEALLQTFNFLSVMQPTMDGTFSADDCVIFTRDGQRYLRQVGWQVGDKPVPEYERLIDFEPNCRYDQPWIRID